MSKGIFLGLTTADIIYYVPHHPQNNQNMKTERQLAYAGGAAANAAVTFAAFDNQTTLITGLGNHLLARIAKKDLAEHQVQLIDGTDQPKRSPIHAAILVDLSNGDRSVIYSNTDVRKLRPETINKSMLEDADILLLDGYYLPQAIQMAQWARQLHIPVILDSGIWREDLDALLPLVNYAICSSAFFPPGCTDTASVLAHLDSYGIEHMAITRGEDSIIARSQGETTELPVMPVKTVDTLGAGDIFHGAFCHYILNHGFLTSLARAAEVATLSCASLGTRAWIEQEKFA